MRHRYGAKNPQSWMLRTHAQTAGVSLTAQQPLINIARVAIQALAAVLGGTNSLHTDAYDEALALPTEESAKIALRTQQIIAYESGVTHTADPLGGSYYVEWLTDQMETRAMQIIEEIRRMGGVVRAIEEGYFLREIADASYRFQQEVERGERIIVGVNAFQDEGSPSTCPSSLSTPRWSAYRPSGWPRCGANAIQKPSSKPWQPFSRPPGRGATPCPTSSTAP
jgi:methylmalonyl-CoA mutase, N-terminal domain